MLTLTVVELDNISLLAYTNGDKRGETNLDVIPVNHTPNGLVDLEISTSAKFPG